MSEPTQYTPSYYAASANAAMPHAPVIGDVSADICVVGGGIAGCSAALHLAERGYQVTLLEEHCVGWGASGRSGAQALPGFACGQETLIRILGAHEARALWDMSVEGLGLLKDCIARYRIDCDWVSGHMQAALKRRHSDELLAAAETVERDYGYRGLRVFEGPELRAVLGTHRYVAGLYDPNAGHLHPLNYTLGLVAAAQAQRVKIHEGTRALRYERAGGQVTVLTPSGKVRCRQLILCGNAYLNETASALGRKIMGVGTYIIATEPLGEARARALIANNMAVADMNWVLDYFRLSADRRLLFGGRVSYSGLDATSAIGATRARMLRVFPQLGDVKIDYSWGGYVDITLNRAPHFGRLGPDVYFLQGFSGHGIALAGLAGKLVAEAVAGTAERFDLFTRIPHRDFPGGRAFRRPALVLAMLYYRLLDLL